MIRRLSIRIPYKAFRLTRLLSTRSPNTPILATDFSPPTVVGAGEVFTCFLSAPELLSIARLDLFLPIVLDQLNSGDRPSRSAKISSRFFGLTPLGSKYPVVAGVFYLLSVGWRIAECLVIKPSSVLLIAPGCSHIIA